MDAQKTIPRIMGVAQLLKHKPGAKDQAQLVQQLTATLGASTTRSGTSPTSIPSSPARSRWSFGTPISIADQPRRGGIKLQAEQDVRVEAEPVTSRSTARGRSRSSKAFRDAADRTPAGKTITVRLLHDGTAR